MKKRFNLNYVLLCFALIGCRPSEKQSVRKKDPPIKILVTKVLDNSDHLQAAKGVTDSILAEKSLLEKTNKIDSISTQVLNQLAADTPAAAAAQGADLLLQSKSIIDCVTTSTLQNCQDKAINSL